MPKSVPLNWIISVFINWLSSFGLMGLTRIQGCKQKVQITIVSGFPRVKFQMPTVSEFSFGRKTKFIAYLSIFGPDFKTNQNLDGHGTVPFEMPILICLDFVTGVRSLHWTISRSIFFFSYNGD